jgi:uncharacterized protein YukE
MKKLNRPHALRVYVDDYELSVIRGKLREAGTTNLSTYCRDMVLGGQVVVQDFSAIKDMTAELGRISYEFNRIGNNINQVAKKANETESVDSNSVEELRQEFLELTQEVERLKRAFHRELNKTIEQGES